MKIIDQEVKAQEWDTTYYFKAEYYEKTIGIQVYLKIIIIKNMMHVELYLS